MVPNFQQQNPATTTHYSTKTHESRVSPSDDKWIALRNFRRAKGLCYTCGERWAKEHRCQGTVQLHIVQEMVELLQSCSTEVTLNLRMQQT